MKNICLNGIAILLVAVSFSSCSKKSEAVIAPVTPTGVPANFVYNYAAVADSMQNSTYLTFLSANHNYFIQNNSGTTNFNYWPNAHALDVLTDGYLRTNNTAYTTKMKTLLNGIKVANNGTYSNDYYDDMGWLANASLRDYLITNDADYLNVATSIYSELQGGSNPTMGGGIAWRKTQLYYKNIPSTGNVCIFASRIYKLQNKAEDLALAKSLYDWMKATLVNSAGEVQDGINRNNDGKVDNWVFTYNQGLFIGSAVELYNNTKNPVYLADAVRTANNVLVDQNLLASGLLKSEGQGDGGLFKGILVRYMTLLIEVADLDATTRTSYINFLQKNVQSLYIKGIARPSMMASPDWSVAPGYSTDLTTQLSGMMMMEAAAKLKVEGKMQ